MIDLNEILSIVRAEETREIVHCVGMSVALGLLAIPALVALWRHFYCRFGLFFCLIAAGFLYSMANKATISVVGETPTNLVFHCDVNTNLVGEAGYFRYNVIGEDNTRYSSYFIVPSTNFNYTLPGCYIGGGKNRHFQLVIEKTTSNEAVTND